MMKEATLRRPEFRPGLRVRLADGQEWSLPPPIPTTLPDPQGRISERNTEYRQLIEAISLAETDAELGRTELALAIHLLHRNYMLRPDDFAALLEASPRGYRAELVRESLRTIAMHHSTMSEPGAGRETRIYSAA